MAEEQVRRRRRRRTHQPAVDDAGPGREAAVGSAAWLAVLAVIALVAVVFQVDRAGRHDFFMAVMVPESLRAASLDQTVRASLKAGNGAEAMAMARDQIQRQPVPAESLSNYALAASLTGDAAAADRAILLAAARGWRDPLVQQTMVTAAIAGGEWGIAADRALALRLAGVNAEAASGALDELLRAPGGRATIARKLVTDRQWHDNFLDWGAPSANPGAFAQVVVAAVASGASFECVNLSDASGTLLRRGGALAAAQAWTGPCAKRSNVDPRSFALTADGAKEFAGPFAWSYPTPAGVVSSVRREAGNYALDYQNDQALNAPIAERMMLLAPGVHTVTARLTSGDSFPTGRLSLTLSCIDAQGTSKFVSTHAFSPEPLAVEVPAQCPVQHFRLNGLGAARGLVLSGA